MFTNNTGAYNTRVRIATSNTEAYAAQVGTALSNHQVLSLLLCNSEMTKHNRIWLINILCICCTCQSSPTCCYWGSFFFLQSCRNRKLLQLSRLAAFRYTSHARTKNSEWVWVAKTWPYLCLTWRGLSAWSALFRKLIPSHLYLTSSSSCSTSSSASLVAVPIPPALSLSPC